MIWLWNSNTIILNRKNWSRSLLHICRSHQILAVWLSASQERKKVASYILSFTNWAGPAQMLRTHRSCSPTPAKHHDPPPFPHYPQKYIHFLRYWPGRAQWLDRQRPGASADLTQTLFNVLQDLAQCRLSSCCIESRIWDTGPTLLCLPTTKISLCLNLIRPTTVQHLTLSDTRVTAAL